MTKEVGAIIRRARKKKGMTLVELAKAMGLSYQAVAQYERGERKPGLDKLIRLCNVLGISIPGVVENINADSIWIYYRNDEGKARWRCSCCGKICKRHPAAKYYCSNCGAKMTMEA